LGIEAILQEIGRFTAEGADQFLGFHDPNGAHGMFPVIENGDDQPTLAAGMSDEACCGTLFVSGNADRQVTRSWSGSGVVVTSPRYPTT